MTQEEYDIALMELSSTIAKQCTASADMQLKIANIELELTKVDLALAKAGHEIEKRKMYRPNYN